MRFFRSVFVSIVAIALAACSVSPNGSVNQANFDRIEALLSEGEASYEAGQLDSSKKSFQQVLELDGSETRALYRLGTIDFRMKDLPEAARYFERVIAKDPRHSRAHYNLATIRLIQAENHFKYFTATTDPKTDVTALTDLLGAIEEFARVSSTRKMKEVIRPAHSLNRQLPANPEENQDEGN